MINLSLSGRLFESPNGPVLDRDAFITFAHSVGFAGVELRYPQMPMETPDDEVQAVRANLAANHLTWVFGTVEGILTPDMFARSVTTMKKQQAGGALFTRFTIFNQDQVPQAQAFADEAAALGVTCIMQLHANTVADSVDHALEALKLIDRPNLRLAYDANHLMFDGELQYVDAITTLAPHIAAVSLQNFKPAPPDAPANERVEVSGNTYVRALPGDPQGIDFPAVFTRLKDIGFAGFATTMCDCIPGMPPQQLSQAWHDYLKPLC